MNITRMDVRPIPVTAEELCDYCADTISAINHGGITVTLAISSTPGTITPETISLERHTFLCSTCAKNLAAMIDAQIYIARVNYNAQKV